MKNNNLFLMAALLFALISCGTANRSAYNGSQQYMNSIYYSPNQTNGAEYVQQQQYLQELQKKTTDNMATASSYDAATRTQTVYVGEENQVDITYNPTIQYSIVDDAESYEARLRKFDSPTYTINIEFDTYPWWNYDWRWYRGYSPYWSASWYSPWWNWRYDWYGHYPYSYYNSWYHYPYWAWDPFYDPWWGPAYYPVHRPHPGPKPGYYPGHGPGAAPGYMKPGRDVYYGKRNSNPAYRPTDRPAGNSVNNGPAPAKPAQGSVTRRPANANQINGGTRAPEQKYPQPGNSGAETRKPQGGQQPPMNSNSSNGGTRYRRVTPEQQANSTKGDIRQTEKKEQGKPAGNNRNYNKTDNSRTSYSRSSSNHTRSSYSQSSGSRSTGYSNPGNSGRSSGNSGSSYRRR